MQRLLTRKEAMDILRVSKNTMTKLMRTPGFPAYKIQGTIRIGEDELEDWMKTQKWKKGKRIESDKIRRVENAKSL